jgi:hypothetical protein
MASWHFTLMIFKRKCKHWYQKKFKKRLPVHLKTHPLNMILIYVYILKSLSLDLSDISLFEFKNNLVYIVFSLILSQILTLILFYKPSWKLTVIILSSIYNKLPMLLKRLSFNSQVSFPFCTGPLKTLNPNKIAGKLTILPTPIGNLQDLSPNIIKSLFKADVIGC